MLLLIFLFGCFLHHISGLPTFAADCLREHNLVRARHGAAPLQWDSTLAQQAQQWADHLKKATDESSTGTPPSIHSKTTEGESVYWAMDPSCKDAVEEWADEFYDYKGFGYCLRAPRRPPSYMMHFTQLVWKSTTKLGVGISGDFLVARYSPKGNSYRHYGNNVQC